MNTYRGLNFGPTLGPIGPGVDRATLGKLVGVTVRWKDQSSPLNAGGWHVDVIYFWVDDEPVGGNLGGGPGSGGSGKGGGSEGRGGSSGGSGFGLVPWYPGPLRPIDPPLDCADWTKGVGPSGGPVRCPAELQAKIKATYLELYNSTSWANFLAQFGTGLLTCVRNVSFCDFEFDCDCNAPNYEERTEDYKEGKRKRHYFCFGADAYNDKRKMQISLAYGLLRSCGVKYFEALLLSEAFARDTTWNATREERLADLRSAVRRGELKEEDVEDATGRKRHIYYGDYIWYDPETGEVGPFPMIAITFPVSSGTRKLWKL